MSVQKKLVKGRKTSYPGAHSGSGGKRLFLLPWPAAMFVLLCLGVLLAGWTLKVVADNILVTAKVPAPLVTGPAVITSPASGSVFSAIPINVSGTCPADGSAAYVELFRDDVFSGSGLCLANKTFQISTDLFKGSNNLKARIFNSTDDEGPVSAGIVVYFNPPTPPSSTGAPAAPSPPGAAAGQPQPNPFLLNLQNGFRYTGYYVGQTVQLRLVAAGGTPPYELKIGWGDSDPKVLIKKPGSFTVSHVYSRPGSYRSSYTIKIFATDLAGNKTFMQLFVIINADKRGGFVTIGNTYMPGGLSTFLLSFKKWLWLAWPAYGIVVLMSVSYLLGEKEELLILKNRRKLRRRRA